MALGGRRSRLAACLIMSGRKICPQRVPPVVCDA